MIPAEIIALKRDGHSLSDDHIAEFVSQYVREEVSDAQMAAMAMAIFLNGMNASETATLTRQMLQSGEQLVWDDDGRPVIDKHSTGGIGDKVSLVLAPLLACFDIRVPMISGRGLGPTGGTLDKLESIPGFRCDLTIPEIQSTTDQVGCVITGATAELVPADRKLYSLRDVTATVPSIPLITASIMSKKLAEGLAALVLDVKTGSGAGMKTVQDSQRLAQSMVDVGTLMGLKTSALVTDMHQPLGRMIGNAVEVNESIDTLQGSGPEDLQELTIELAAKLLVAVDICESVESARSRLGHLIDSGQALEKFAEMIAAQGGNIDTLRSIAPVHEVVAENSGIVSFNNSERLGAAVIQLGGGRKLPKDQLDHSVGIETLVRHGDRVDRNQPLFRIFADPDKLSAVKPLINEAVAVVEHPVEARKLVVDQIGV